MRLRQEQLKNESLQDSPPEAFRTEPVMRFFPYPAVGHLLITSRHITGPHSARDVGFPSSDTELVSYPTNRLQWAIVTPSDNRGFSDRLSLFCHYSPVKLRENQ